MKLSHVAAIGGAAVLAYLIFRAQAGAPGSSSSGANLGAGGDYPLVPNPDQPASSAPHEIADPSTPGVTYNIPPPAPHQTPDTGGGTPPTATTGPGSLFGQSGTVSSGPAAPSSGGSAPLPTVDPIGHPRSTYGSHFNLFP